MKIIRPKNTKKSGLIEYLCYRNKGHYVGVCLSFNIIEEGKDLSALQASLEEAAMLHLKTVRKHNLSDDLLNRHAPEQYWKIYFSLQTQLAKEKTQSVASHTMSSFNARYMLDDILGHQKATALNA